jgi:hypothetical protein
VTYAELAARPGRAPSLDPELEDVDKLAGRWASGDRSSGATLHPLEAIRLLHDGAVLGGGQIPTPEDVLKFDECYMQSSSKDRSLIAVWYQTGGSSEQKARRLGISRSTLYVEWKRTLSYFRGWLRAHGIDI